MNQAKLCSRKWAHFEDSEYMLNLLRNGQDLLLIGPPRTGKSELIADLSGSVEFLRINCFTCSKITSLRKLFFESLSREFGLSKPIITFSGFLKHAAEIKMKNSSKNDLRAYIIKPIIVVFENAQNLMQISVEETIEFFKVYERFVSEMSHLTLIQTILVSTTELPVKYFKVYLPYAPTVKLRERISEVVTAKTTGHLQEHVFNQHFKLKFVNVVIGFEIIAKDFDSIELVTAKLLHFLLADLCGQSHSNIGSVDLKNFHTFPKVNNLFADDIKNIYLSIKEIKLVVEKLSPQISESAQAGYDYSSASNFYRKEIMQNLPIIPSYILLACYLAQNNGKSKDAVILGLVKRTNARKKQSIIEKAGPKKSFSISRVIWIVEALINNQRNSEAANDLNLVFHSNEFYLTFNFFERLNWLKQDQKKHMVPKHYQLTCDQHFIDMVIRRLGFNRKEFVK